MPVSPSDFTRYALFYLPPAQAGWARFATGWLGWDCLTGGPARHPHLPDLAVPVAEITQSPRKYGLHGTIKPPFRLAKGATFDDLEAACADLCRSLPAIDAGLLRLTRLGRFLALCPDQSPKLSELAGRCVRELDRFRALPTPEEMDRRRAAHLTPRQEGNLKKWGYPHVMDDFRFHITLTGRLAKPVLSTVEMVLETTFAPLLSEDFRLNDLALVGEKPSGKFQLIRRFELSGSNPGD
ncbi:MAG: DUF1045 domain-containing protein [Rhodobacteraceae bacterium]|nr:DUF1045 domain-containing protein [Paracoccaceae bacterium]